MKYIDSLVDLRVGAYVDGLNVYHGGRHLCGRDAPGWRWFDLAASVERMIARNAAWTSKGATLHRLVYCTALIRGEIDADGRHRQEAYLAALRADDRIAIELGRFALRKVRRQAGEDGVRETRKAFDEKGSDVNVASHLLIDIHTHAIDAAVLISNDSDLRLPAQHARTRVPTATVNPRGRPTARDLRGEPHEGVGGHWWYRLTAEDFFGHQLPEVVGGARKPAAW